MIANLCDQLRQRDASVTAVSRARSSQARERQHLPPDRFQQPQLGVIGGNLAGGVVPVPAVVLDGKHHVGEREVNVVLIDGIQRDWKHPSFVKCGENLGFIGTQFAGTLTPFRTIAQIVMTALRATDSLCGFRHQRRSFVGGQGCPIGRIAARRTELAANREVRLKLFPTVLANALAFGNCGPFSTFKRAVMNRTHLTGFEPKRLTATNANNWNRHNKILRCKDAEKVGRGSAYPRVSQLARPAQALSNVSRIIPKPNGSLIVLPILTTPLGSV